MYIENYLLIMRIIIQCHVSWLLCLVLCQCKLTISFYLGTHGVRTHTTCTHSDTHTHAHTPLIISKLAQTEQYLLPLVQGTEWELGDDLSLQLVAGCGLVAVEKEHACVHIILLSVA